jgi:hypothetical protein
MKAKCIKNVSNRFAGEAFVFELDPPAKDDNGKEHKLVVTSAVTAPHTGCEVLVFPCHKNGKPKSWLEIGGSRGHLSANKAIRDMGYEIV